LHPDTHVWCFERACETLAADGKDRAARFADQYLDALTRGSERADLGFGDIAGVPQRTAVGFLCWILAEVAFIN